MDKVALSLGMLPEGRCSKRVADDANILHTPPYSLTKKIKLDEHLVNNDPIQEHWKVIEVLCFEVLVSLL